MPTAPLVIVGRSSSHFTRIARIFALELEVPCELQVVRDLMSTDANDYGGNPALKIPSLQTSDGTWFGALNVSRELARRSPSARSIVWPEDLRGSLAANAQELVLSAMSSGVSLILSKLGATDANAPETPAQRKLRASLEQTLNWLEAHVAEVLASLPEGELSFLQVSLFCLVEHLAFRAVTDTAPHVNLRAFAATFGERASARETVYRFDV
jgi:glutathione S-transferase